VKVNLIIFWGIWIIIGILIIFNLKIWDLGNKFDEYCVEQYDINDNCPCSRPLSQENVISLNLTPVYTQTQHPS